MYTRMTKSMVSLTEFSMNLSFVLATESYMLVTPSTRCELEAAQPCVKLLEVRRGARSGDEVEVEDEDENEGWG